MDLRESTQDASRHHKRLATEMNWNRGRKDQKLESLSNNEQDEEQHANGSHRGAAKTDSAAVPRKRCPAE
ncbi:UNVERIFIED_CONTAM: hypothetical protein Sradi_0620500 [Sesamum radiatum]|uniref:Uncharacterized protein n=1 Tax=Sesamum radiatum TaxID=300843 RepID=A0AAW2VPE5_SESRA